MGRSMAQFTTAEGFRFWREEVQMLEKPEKDVPYIPMVALVGLYVAAKDRSELTSYDWRQTVLRNQDAVDGLRYSLHTHFRYDLEETYEFPIYYVRAEPDSSLQSKSTYASLIDGLPVGVASVRENEWFLARNLGLADHDDAVYLNPLRLAAGGMQTVANNYPRTAELLGEQP